MNRGDKIYSTYFLDNKLYFVLQHKEIVFQPLPEKLSNPLVCIKNGYMVKYDPLTDLRNVVIEQIEWKTVILNNIVWEKKFKDNLDWTFLYLLTESGDSYYFFCNLGIFNCITKLHDTSEPSFLEKFYHLFNRSGYQTI